MNISRMSVNNSELKAICDGLEALIGLEKLNMISSIKGNQAIIFASCLQFLPGLVELNIGDMRADDTGIKAICDGLKTATRLEKLNMYKCIRSHEQARIFASCLEFLSRLVELNIGGLLSIDDLQQEGGVKAIVQALKRVTTLTHLDLVKWRPKSRHKWIFKIMQEEGFQTNKIRTMEVIKGKVHFRLVVIEVIITL